jgi:uncharacterized membrane protein
VSTQAARTSSSGGTDLDPNVAAALAYLFAPLGGIAMYFLEGEEDQFVRFHAVQGIAFGIALIAVWMGLGFVAGAFSFLLALVNLGGLVPLLVTPLFGLLSLAGFAAWAFLTFKAYQGERFVIPVIGSYAESY